MKKFIALVLVSMMVCGVFTCANAEQTAEPIEAKSFGETALDVLTWPFNNGFDKIGETFTETMDEIGKFAERTWNDTTTWVIGISNDVGTWIEGIF